MAFAGADGSAIARKPSRGGVFAAGFDMCTRMRVRGAMRDARLWIDVGDRRGVSRRIRLNARSAATFHDAAAVRSAV